MNVGSAKNVFVVAAAAFPKHSQQSQLYFLTFPNLVPAMCDGLLFLSYFISFHILYVKMEETGLRRWENLNNHVALGRETG